MWKVKDGVDLKELEKYGFKLYKGYYKNKGYYKKNLEFSDIEIFVDVEQRIIERSNQFVFTKVYEDEIQDLIKADLVEKVDE